MLRLTLITLMLFGSVAQAQAGAEDVPLLRQTREWLTACDNLRNCHALSAPSGQKGPEYSSLTLHVTRRSGPQESLRLRLDHRGAPLGRFELLLDGQPLSLELQAGMAVELDDQGRDAHLQSYAVIMEDDGRKWLQQLRNAQLLQMAGEEQASVSLSGLSAALLLMDSVQGRLDGVTALMRPGPRPANEVPPRQLAPAPRAYSAAPPALSEQERARITAAVLKDQVGAMGEADKPRVEVYPLTAQRALTVLYSECAAYNCDYQIGSRSRSNPAKDQPLKRQPAPLEVEDVGSVSYDPKSGLLTTFYKLRGLGDCGDQSQWLFDGQGFQLMDFRRMPLCSGLRSSDWPALWNSRD